MDDELKELHLKHIIETLQQHIRSSAKVTREVLETVSPGAANTLSQFMLETYYMKPLDELLSESKGGE